MRQLAALLLGLFLMAACQQGRTDATIGRNPDGDPIVGESRGAEPVNPVESGDHEAETADPDPKGLDLQPEQPGAVLESGKGPYPIGEDIERPRRLDDSEPIEGLVAMMRSGEYVWGVCIFQVTVSETGEVGDVVFLKPEHLAPEVEHAITEGVRAWRFSPATKAGEPIAVYYNLLIHHCPFQRRDNED